MAAGFAQKYDMSYDPAADKKPVWTGVADVMADALGDLQARRAPNARAHDEESVGMMEDELLVLEGENARLKRGLSDYRAYGIPVSKGARPARDPGDAQGDALAKIEPRSGDDLVRCCRTWCRCIRRRRR